MSETEGISLREEMALDAAVLTVLRHRERRTFERMTGYWQEVIKEAKQAYIERKQSLPKPPVSEGA